MIGTREGPEVSSVIVPPANGNGRDPARAPAKRRAKRGDGSLWKRPGSRFWWYVLSHRGRLLRGSTGETDKKKAVEVLKAKRDELAAARRGYTVLVGPEVQRVTVGDLLDRLVGDYTLRGVKSLVQVKTHLIPVRDFFGAIPAVDVTEADVDRYITERRKAGKADATINRGTQLLGQALRPFLEKHQRPTPTIRRLREDNARQGFFERGEFEAVIARLNDPDVADFYEWFFYTGMRPKETKSLTWAAFDKETWTLRLHAKDAKTGKGRVIVLAGPLRVIAERRLKARRLDCPLIFHEDGEALGEFRKRWKRACREAGVQDRRPYDLRRTAVRNLIRAGVPERVAMDISGHRTRAVFDRYNISNEKDVEEAMEKVGAYVQSLPGGRKVRAIRAAR